VSYSFCVKMTFSGKPRTAANLESKMMNCFLVTGFGFLRQQWVTGAKKTGAKRNYEPDIYKLTWRSPV
jgi:hypothetical protein